MSSTVDQWVKQVNNCLAFTVIEGGHFGFRAVQNYAHLF